MIVATIFLLVLTLVCTPLCLLVSFCINTEEPRANFFVKFLGIKILVQQVHLVGAQVVFSGTVNQSFPVVSDDKNSVNIAKALTLEEATLCVCSNVQNGFASLFVGEIFAFVSSALLCKFTNAKVFVYTTCSTKNSALSGDVWLQCTLLSIVVTLVKEGVASWKARKSMK